jgi:DNA-binding response OmpR family regulator
MIRALVLDDDPTFARVISDLLGMSGYSISTAHSAGEALSLAHRGHYDLAVLDIALPGPIDGVDVASVIRSQSDSPAVILITGLASESRINEGLRQGAYTCITKPCELEDLLLVVQRALTEGQEVTPCV